MLPKTLAQFIWHFIKKRKTRFIVIQLAAFAWSIDNTAWPYAFKLLIDKITGFESSGSTHLWYYLMPILAFWAILWITMEAMFRTEGILMARTFPWLEAKVRMAMFRYVENHAYHFFANQFAGNISNKISDMTQSITRILQLIIMIFIPGLLALLIATGIFFSITPYFALIIFGWASLHISISLTTAKYCSRLSNAHATSRSFLTGKIVDNFTNIINVKIFARQRFECDYIQQFQNDERNKNQRSLMAVEKIKIALGISCFLFPGVLLTWYEIYCWQHKIIGLGDLVLIFNTSWNIIMIAWFAGMELPNLFKEIGICQQALSIIKAPHDIEDHPWAKDLLVKQGDIVFDKVSFQYVKNQPVFDELSLNIKAGSKVGLVGFSGGGKSTLVNLIMRFFDIQSGRILIDGQDIRDVKRDSLREQISMIPQNPTLFHRSIRDNILYGKTDATEEEILAASQHAHCDEFIKMLPQGYDALVGERGIKLSGGQRQRIAIARAILKNAPILILDEATSALDSVTESYIQDALCFLMKDRTTIVIAHRLSTLSEMDRILVFDQGKIIEDGTHDELLKQQGHYAHMWKMQAGGFLPDFPQ